MKNPLQKILQNIPKKPGVYIHKDTAGKILYIGKAVNLKSRVSSYFQKKGGLAPDKQAMVERIKKIEYIITSNETEALLLETSLIKKHQPPYNIIMKDDKYFKYIKITIKEEFPRVFTVRQVNKDGAVYFGPYTSGLSVNQTLKLLRSLFPHRNFQSPTSEKYVSKMHQRYPELLGPQDQAEYRQTIDRIIKFLKGDYENIKKELMGKMNQYSVRKEYEKAAQTRDKISYIENIAQKQKVVSTKLDDQDIISLHQENGLSAINLFNVRKGKLINKENFTLKNTSHKKTTEIIQEFIKQYYPKLINLPAELIIPVKIADQELLEKTFQLKIKVPRQGKKIEFLRLGEENAAAYLSQQKASWEKENINTKEALAQLKKSLALKKIPKRIETYDISNIQGQHAVGSMVVFIDGRPEKKWYRKFKIKTVPGANDPAMMAEILSRRFRRAETERKEWPQPDLVILDGGKGQLNTVKKKIHTDIDIISLAKKNEEVYLPGRKEAARLPLNSPAYFLIQRMRDEAHRFAITFYRRSHKRENIKSSFDDIPGIGPQTRKKLIKHFGSLDAASQAGQDELLKIVNKKVANNILQYEK